MLERKLERSRNELTNKYCDLSREELIKRKELIKNWETDEKEQKKVWEELKKFSRPFVYMKDNYNIFWNWQTRKIEIDLDDHRYLPCLYFESKEKTLEAIEAVGPERVKRFYLGVEEY